MRAPLHPAWIWLPPVVALAALGLILASGSNHALFLMLNRGGSVLGEQAWLLLTMFGDGAIALVLVLPSIRRAPNCFWAALAAALFAGLWTQVTKQFIDVPRPLAVFGAGEFFHAGPAYRQVSFPSGHAAAAFAMADIAIMGRARGTLVRVVLLLVAVLISLSRIMIGVHWPVDILWGMVGGWVGAWAGLALHGRSGWGTAGAAGTVAGLLLLAMAASLLVSRHIGIPAVMPLQRVVAGACLLWGAWEMAAMLPWRDWLRRHGEPAKARTGERVLERVNEMASELVNDRMGERTGDQAGERGADAADAAEVVAFERRAADG